LSPDGLLDFLEHIELDRELASSQDTKFDVVTLITIHNTKGLEFHKVIITGLEQGLFPRDDKDGEDLEEERRLFYVAATRAMDELYMTSCHLRRMYGRTEISRPSRFLFEATRGAAARGSSLSGLVTHSGDSRDIAASGKRFNVFGDPPIEWLSGEAGFVGRGGEGYGEDFHGLATQNQQTKSSDGRWKLGDGIYNDDYGYGEVVGFKESGATVRGANNTEPQIRVKFQAGLEALFGSVSEAGKYTKVSYD
jgi:DNA helicase-2/ATP-dependent DNA helicase PcrA